MSTIRVPATSFYHLLEVKRSKFHCYIERADTAADAEQLVTRLRLQHSDANHVCSAYIAGVPGNTTVLGCSDDGEPNGTAGKPMLNVLMHSNISYIAAAVARVFGGTKLGTGGLARAYGGAVSAAVVQLQCEKMRLLSTARFLVPFAFEAQARHLLDKFDGRLDAVDYGNEVQFLISLEENLLADFTAELQNASGGQCLQIQSPNDAANS